MGLAGHQLDERLAPVGEALGVGNSRCLGGRHLGGVDRGFSIALILGHVALIVGHLVPVQQ